MSKWITSGDQNGQPIPLGYYDAHDESSVESVPLSVEGAETDDEFLQNENLNNEGVKNKGVNNEVVDNEGVDMDTDTDSYPDADTLSSGDENDNYDDSPFDDDPPVPPPGVLPLEYK